jgi:hypothetical protein
MPKAAQPIAEPAPAAVEPSRPRRSPAAFAPAAELTQLASAINASPRVRSLTALSGEMNQPPPSAAQKQTGQEDGLQPRNLDPMQLCCAEDEPSQRKAEAGTAKPASAANNTGLPHHLKSGIESLSGVSMDDVTVHYNSTQPAQLNALAYAQGTDIHVAAGQEKHLPHEAWHVVQQAQGRVQPTMQMKSGVQLNDDKGLEHEADVMGKKAEIVGRLAPTLSPRAADLHRQAQPGNGRPAGTLSLKASPSGTSRTSPVLQRVITLKDAKGNPYPNKKKKGNATPEEVLGWLFDFMGDAAREAFAQEQEKLEILCEDPEVHFELDARNPKKSYYDFKESFKSYDVKAEKKEREKEKEPPKSIAREGEQGEQEEGDDLELGDLTDLAQVTLGLETLLQPIVTELKSTNSAKRPQRKLELFRPIQENVVSLVQYLVKCLANPLSPFDVAQIVRFQHTFEYDLLSASTEEVGPPVKKLETAIKKKNQGLLVDDSEEMHELQTQMFIEVAEILPITVDPICDSWDKPRRGAYLLQRLQETYGNLLASVQRGTHGSTSVSAKATSLQIIAGFGEMMLCKPMILQIQQIAPAISQICPWDEEALILKIFQQTVRRYKVRSILEMMMGIGEVCPVLLELHQSKRISGEAFASIARNLEEHVNVSYKGKEQLRILRLLVKLLRADGSLTCTEYESRIGKGAPADFVLEGNGLHSGKSRTVYEVEGVPNSVLLDEAYEYLVSRYKHKMSTVGTNLVELGYKLVLAVPLGTKLSASDTKALKSDPRFLYFGDTHVQEAIQEIPEDLGTIHGGPEELLFMHVAHFDMSMIREWRQSQAYQWYQEMILTFGLPIDPERRKDLVARIRSEFLD